VNIDSEFLPIGKLNPDFLSELIEKYTIKNESIVVGPGIGVDAAVIDVGDFYLVAKTDPITFVADDIGYYAININANDIACMGAIPKYFLGTLLLPERKTSKEMVRNIFRQVSEACGGKGISFCGGHTEVTFGIDRPILIGQMLGIADKDSLVNIKNGQPGDDILLTKGIAIEAVSIFAREKEDKLIKTFSDEFVEKCKKFIYDPGISVLEEARLSVQKGGVKGMHDPTEGGLAMGLHELASATGCGLKIFGKEIPVFPEAKFLCDMYDIDVMGVIASGALLIICEKQKSHSIIEELKQHQIKAKLIGKMMEPEFGTKLVSDENEIDLPKFHQDEITKLFK